MICKYNKITLFDGEEFPSHYMLCKTNPRVSLSLSLSLSIYIKYIYCINMYNISSGNQLI